MTIMLVSIANLEGIKEGSRTQYFTGHFDGYSFVPDDASQAIRWIDYGRDNYADVTPTVGWRGAMTIPRELALETRNGEIVLIQRPVKEMETIRVPLLEVEGKALCELNSKCKALQLETYEIIAEFELVAGVESFGFKLRTSTQEETVVGYSLREKMVFVDRNRSGVIDFHEDFPGRHEAALQPDQQRMQFRILVDRSSVEVFANEGHKVITEANCPSPGSLGLFFFCHGEDELPYKVKLHKLI